MRAPLGAAQELRFNRLMEDLVLIDVRANREAAGAGPPWGGLSRRPGARPVPGRDVEIEPTLTGRDGRSSRAAAIALCGEPDELRLEVVCLDLRPGTGLASGRLETPNSRRTRAGLH
jgi:hypothetical protein